MGISFCSFIVWEERSQVSISIIELLKASAHCIVENSLTRGWCLWGKVLPAVISVSASGHSLHPLTEVWKWPSKTGIVSTRPVVWALWGWGVKDGRLRGEAGGRMMDADLEPHCLSSSGHGMIPQSTYIPTKHHPRERLKELDKV